MARKRRSVCDLRVRDVTPYLAAVILLVSLVGYLGGYIIIDLSHQRRQSAVNAARQLDDVIRQHVPETVQQTSSSNVAVNEASLPNVTPPVKRSSTPNSASAQQFPEAPSGTGVCEGACQRRSGRASSDGQWFDWSSPSFILYAYSALFDDRPTLEFDKSQSAGFVRVIVVSSKLSEKSGDGGSSLSSDLYCHLCYDDGKAVDVRLDGDPKPIGYGWKVNDRDVREYIYSCLCPAGSIPTSVTLRERATPGQVDRSCLPVQVIERKDTQNDMAVCAGVLKTSPEPYLMIEWLELLRLTGVSMVSFYTMGDLIKNTPGEKVLSYYSSASAENFVDLRKTSFIGSSLDAEQYVLHSSPAINDCIYRNMYRYRYIMVIDPDEIIMPQLGTSVNLSQLMSRLEQEYSRSRPSNYVFWNVYHFTDGSPNIRESPYLTILRYPMKTPLSEYGRGFKSIIDPRACVHMHNQYCWGVTPGLTKSGQSYFEVVNPDIAVKHTYRKCPFDSTQCKNLLANATMDKSLQSLRLELEQRVSQVVLTVLGHDI